MHVHGNAPPTCGQDAIDPSGVAAQSCARIRAAISPPPAGQGDVCARSLAARPPRPRRALLRSSRPTNAAPSRSPPRPFVYLIRSSSWSILPGRCGPVLAMPRWPSHRRGHGAGGATRLTWQPAERQRPGRLVCPAPRFGAAQARARRRCTAPAPSAGRGRCRHVGQHAQGEAAPRRVSRLRSMPLCALIQPVVKHLEA